MAKTTLTILWTQDNKITLEKMIGMYARNAVRNGWWDAVRVVLWGASSALAGGDAEVRQFLKDLMNADVAVHACKACADDLGVTETLESIGVTVEYWGVGLTEAIKDGTLLTV
jgi:hypothetical protein